MSLYIGRLVSLYILAYHLSLIYLFYFILQSFYHNLVSRIVHFNSIYVLMTPEGKRPNTIIQISRFNGCFFTCMCGFSNNTI